MTTPPPKSATWPAGPQSVALATFLANVVPLDFAGEPYRNLLDMVRRLGEDSTDRLIIDELISQYRHEGRFNTPIRIEDGMITNGCHRLAALVEAGASEVDIWVVCGGVVEPAPYGGAITEVEFRVTPGPGRQGNDPDGLDTDALWTIRSVPIPGGWLEADGASSRHGDGYVTVIYEYYAPEDVVRGAIPLLLERLAASGITAKVAHITPAAV